MAAVCRRWIYSTCLDCALDAQQREQSGFHYEYSVYQFEYNRDLIFHQGCEMSAVLEALVDRNRVRMNVPRLKTILGRKNRPHLKKQKRLTAWQVTVERPSYDLTIFKVHCGKLALKIYSKGERVLRTEAMARNVDALKCGRSLERFPRMVQALKDILERFLESLSCMDQCFVSGVRLEDFPEPSVIGEARIAGLDFNRTRTLQVARAVLALSVMPKGFTASQLADHVRRQTIISSKPYSCRLSASSLRSVEIPRQRPGPFDRQNPSVRADVERLNYDRRNSSVAGARAGTIDPQHGSLWTQCPSRSHVLGSAASGYV